MPLVLCTCIICREKNCIVNGIDQPGQLVDSSTRLRHEKPARPTRTTRHNARSSPSTPPNLPSSPSPKSVTIPIELIVNMICILVVWLHIRGGVSRSVANKILLALQLIISTTLQLIELALLASGFSVRLSNIHIPFDVRTAYKHQCTEPDIIRTACCPECFTLFPRPIPWKCLWKASPKSRPCNTELWKRQNTQNGVKWVPKVMYSTQSFDSWLLLFLSRQTIDNSLEETYQHRIHHPSIAFGAEMADIQDSPAWKDLHGFFQSTYHLIFGIYVDWFNPFTNKIAGKTVSCGVIVLYCLNLPPHLRYQPENVFIIGLMPPPHSPNTTTISHLIDPVVTAIAKYTTAPGQVLPTFQHPNGIPVQVKAAPLIADLDGSRKVSGFMQHAATMFCSFCLCTHDQIEDLGIQSWELRNGATVRDQAEAWRNEVTRAGKEAQEKSTGVRWTPLYRLPYWDPVKHVVLGFMHNWLEGVLQHHLRSLWGIGRGQEESKRVGAMDEDENWTDTDVSESAEELSDLEAELAAYSSDIPSSGSSSSITPTVSMAESHHTPSPAPSLQFLFDNNIDDDDDDPDFIPIDPEDFKFSVTELQAIRNCIQDVSLPTWVQRPPTNLGEPSHGKLKARDYLTLFTCIFPLIIPEFWHTPNATHTFRQHLFSFLHLVAATNIIASFKTSNFLADAYTQHYIAYRVTIQQLFPHYASKPNHHYAMHNSDLLKYWGPLASFSEFPGERMNGMLQKIKTNRRLRDMDFTMLTQMSRRAQLDALLHDQGRSTSKELANILEPSDTAATATLSSTAVAQFIKNAPPLEMNDYMFLLNYLHSTGRPYRALHMIPHPANAFILPPNAGRPLQIHHNGYTFSCYKSHKGNSAIQFYNPSTQQKDTGFIQVIWTLPLEALLHAFILVSPHSVLSDLEERQAPFIHHSDSIMTKIVDLLPSNNLVIIEPRHIITHLTTFQRPSGTYGIGRETLIVCWALNRGRQ